MEGCSAAYSFRIAGVWSVDPSSTITHRAGGSDWASTLSSVRRRYWASLRQGEMATYRRVIADLNSEDQTVTPWRWHHQSRTKSPQTRDQYRPGTPAA